MRRLMTCLVIVASFLMIVSAASATAIDYVVVVTDGVTSQPISGALVTLEGQGEFFRKTTVSGEAFFDGIPSGTYSIKVEATGYDVVTDTVVVDETERRRHIIVW